MKFTVILPARLSSSRLPEKALADIAGKPMIVRAAEQAAQSHAQKIIVATDHPRIQAACTAHQIVTVMTSEQHTSGTTRLAEAAQLLDLADDEIVVNVQGDERVAQKLANNKAPMATAAHYIHDFNEFINPNCVKVVLNQAGNALYFSRAPIAYPRDLMLADKPKLPQPAPLRHIGIYAYRVDFLKKYANLSASPLEICESLEQLRVLWHGYEIAVEVLDFVPPAGVDTAEDLARIRAYFD